MKLRIVWQLLAIRAGSIHCPQFESVITLLSARGRFSSVHNAEDSGHGAGGPFAFEILALGELFPVDLAGLSLKHTGTVSDFET